LNSSLNGGVIERYYRATARCYRLAPSLAGEHPANTNIQRATLEAAAQELVRAAQHADGHSPGVRVRQYPVRLSQAALARVLGHLDAIEAECRDAAVTPEASDDGASVLLTYVLHPLPLDAH
jgi:hypothetical protein